MLIRPRALTDKKPGLLLVFLIIFLDLVGFGIMVPILAYYVIQLGAVGYSLAMLLTIIAGEQGSYYGAMAAMALQSGFAALALTSMQSLVSQCAAPTERGMVLGVYSSAGTLGRVLGTLATGVLFAQVHIQSPYVVSSLLMVCLFTLAISVQSHWREHRG